MSESIKKENLIYDDKADVSINGSPILGRLKGTCADIINATRNGRKYSESLWEKVFNDPIVKEYFDCGGIFGELGHPADREEIDMEKIAICMPEPPKKDDNGHLVASFDILNTPNGRILKCLCDYGYKMGISSRGSGDVIDNYDGTESVDEGTYHFECFDVVLLPAVKEARLDYVNESLNKDKKSSLKKALSEALKSSTLDEKKVMIETLNDLHIDYKVSPQEGVTNKVVSNEVAVDNVKANLSKNLQEAVVKNNELEQKVLSLQEKLSVCYAKESEQEDLIESQRGEIERLKSRNSNSVKLINESKETAKKVNENLQMKDDKIAHLNSEIEKLNKKISTLESGATKNEKLKESYTHKLQDKNATIKELTSKVDAITTKANKLKESYEGTIETLREDCASLEKDLQIKNNEYSTKLAKTNGLVEKYKTMANTAVGKYIELQANKLGVSTNEIKNRLSESYTFEDIDKICEDLQEYKVNMSNLPFNFNSDTRVRYNESIQPKVPANCIEDEIDEQLMSMAGIL